MLGDGFLGPRPKENDLKAFLRINTIELGVNMVQSHEYV